jgi:hypothetical protein
MLPILGPRLKEICVSCLGLMESRFSREIAKVGTIDAADEGGHSIELARLEMQ